jgi:MFS transporter, DHA1 family, multidrug resistance protein
VLLKGKLSISRIWTPSALHCGAMGFLKQGVGALVSQFGAYLGGHSTSTLPLTAAIFAISILCASTMIFIVPRRTVVVSEELIEQAEEEESGML